MKKIFLILLFGSIFHTSNASFRSYHHYDYPYLNLSYCGNQLIYHQDYILYYEGLSMLLHDYIQYQIQMAQLPPKKFYIEIGCIEFGGHPAIEISQSKTGYHIFLHDRPNLTYLARLIDYFASPNWASFVIQFKDDTKVEHQNTIAFKKFNQLLDVTIPKELPTFFDGKHLELFRDGQLSIHYRHDQLELIIGEQLISMGFQQALPVKLADRYLFVQQNAMKVFNQSGKLLVSRLIWPNQIPHHTTRKLQLKAYTKWVNLYEDGIPIMTYSLEKDALYLVPTK